MFAASLPTSSVEFASTAHSLGARMEAAAEALLRVRNEVVAALDRQVTEIQYLHRALANPPPPMIVTDEASDPVMCSPFGAERTVTERAAFFEHSPKVSGPDVGQAVAATADPTFRAPSARSMIRDDESVMGEAALDPVLERATLEELNDALASAFAMVSARSSR